MALTNGHNANVIAEKRRVINAMKDDCIRGKQKYEIREKFTDGKYENSSKSDRSFYEYWNDMIAKFGEEFEANREQLKSKFISRYLFLYEKMIEKNDLKGAREVLDSLKRMTGMDDPSKLDLNMSGDIQIDFGFTNEKDKE